MSPEPLVVRPRAGRLALTVLGAVAFTAAGVAMILSGGVKEILVGLLSIAFFGVRALRRYAADVRSYGDEVRYNRAVYGWDIALAGAWLDRPGEEFVALLERYRGDATA